MARDDGRSPDELRALQFERHYTGAVPGSVLASCGDTRVLCTASYVDGVPPFLQGRGQGWLTAEYAMLPGATSQRKARDRGNRVDGRSVEIQRLIGRSLRAVVDLAKLTERTLWVDCDVLQADGGTRTTAINGAWVALVDLLTHMDGKRLLRAWPMATQLAAVSVGMVDGEPLCDLAYAEDSRAEVDLNLVMTGDGRFIEIQGAAEGAPFTPEALSSMLALGTVAVRRILAAQVAALQAG